MRFINISPEQHELFLSALKSGQYNLLLGAGSSADSSNIHGPMPMGDRLKNELCGLKQLEEKYPLQRVFSLLTSDEIREHVTDRLSGCTPGKTAKLISHYVWRRIFTWNIDDVLEGAYQLRHAKQKLVPTHFNDDFIDAQTAAEVLCVHLHGCVTSPEKGYVFSREQYISQIQKINPWMTVLSQYLQSEPIIIAGTALDEVDLDYYLAQRSVLTSREDRGPSILVTAENDAIAAHLCRQHNLVQFQGWAQDFFTYCSEVLPSAPTPEELIPRETRRLLPPIVSKVAAIAFAADFELVPATAKQVGATRFLYGHSPTWADLADNIDISRHEVRDIIFKVRRRLADTGNANRLMIMVDRPGGGKTTILRRVSFELAKAGVTVLLCSALARVDPNMSSTLDLIDPPMVIVVDNLADQASAIAELLNRMEKQDIVFLAAERFYRLNYLQQIFSGTAHTVRELLPLDGIEFTRLIDRYSEYGLVGDPSALKHKAEFIGKIQLDPIAIACCRIMNDFHPLDRIVDELVQDSTEYEYDRYLCAAIAEHCLRAGVRYELLIASAGAETIRAQLAGSCALALTYYDAGRSFVIPENTSLAERVIRRAVVKDRDRLLRVFTALARELRPHVNRQTIRRRSPEARLCGRLFDYDDITLPLLGDLAGQFYSDAKQTWQWNSRYWEQVALLNLSVYREADSRNDFSTSMSALERALQYARHALAIEYHPFCLTTLCKILIAAMMVPKFDKREIYGEALEKLRVAIEMEKKWSSYGLQPFTLLLSGTSKYLESGEALTTEQFDKLTLLFDDGERRFRSEQGIKDLISSLRKKLGRR